MKINFTLRRFESSDLPECINLFYDTVHSVNAQHYTPAQLDAWAPASPKQAWWDSMINNVAYVAEHEQQIIGFGDITAAGYLDRLFVHKDYQRCGVAASILACLEREASQLSLTRITAEFSITAKPFAEAHGFHVIEQQEVISGRERLVNYLMEKMLSE